MAPCLGTGVTLPFTETSATMMMIGTS
jgi:hypothetical protein